MAFEFKFPDVGEGIHEGELVKWLVKEGDTVKADQPIAEVETDKAVVEIPSPKTGTILKLNFKEGDTLTVGDVIAVIGEEGEKVEGSTPKEEPAKAPPQETPKEAAPPKAEPAKEAPPAEAMPPPAVPGPKQKPDVPAPEQPTPAAPTKEPAKAVPTPGRVLATPHTRRMAREMGVDITTIKGTGPAGRITDDDLKGGAKAPAPAAPGAAPVGKPGAPATPVSRGHTISFEKYGRVIKVPFKGIRKATSEHMLQAAAKTVPVTHMDEADITELVKVRQKMKVIAANKGIKLTYLPFIIRAILAALKEHRFVNVSLDEENQQIILKQYYNLGIAVDTPDGLLVPVLKNADQYTIMDCALHIQTMAQHARDRELKVDDFKGSTFSITNVGSLGGTHFTPVINYPDAAILGIGRMQDRVRDVDGTFQNRKILPLSLTFDHRLIDGALAAKFMTTIVKHLEDPDLLLVDA